MGRNTPSASGRLSLHSVLVSVLRSVKPRGQSVPQSDDMDRLWDKVQREVSSRGFAMFPSSISLEGPMAPWPRDRGVGPFLDLAKSVGALIVYAESNVLSATDPLDAVATALGRPLEELGAESPEQAFVDLGISSEPEARSVLEFARAHYGQRASVRVDWAHAGVVHRFLRYAAWYSELMERVEGVAGLLDARERGEN